MFYTFYAVLPEKEKLRRARNKTTVRSTKHSDLITTKLKPLPVVDCLEEDTESKSRSLSRKSSLYLN